MRSYHAHLETLQNPHYNPVFRASSLFPVFQNEWVKTRILFLGYWLLKRGISSLTAVITLRNKQGETIQRALLPITEAKAYCIELEDFIKGPFEGSIECEFYSGEPLVFPFPATVLNYYGPSFSTMVHTAERTFNNAEDQKACMANVVPESGFNVWMDEERSPLITFVNGPEKVDHPKMEMTLINEEGKSLHQELKPSTLAPYETWVFPENAMKTWASFLEGKKGTAKLKFAARSVFPRLIVGNKWKKNHALSITHTYYDTSKMEGKEHLWNPPEKRWHPATLMLPAPCRITFYPIMVPSKTVIDLEFYNAEGKKLAEQKEIVSLEHPSLQTISASYPESVSCRLIARGIDGDRIPARIKVALDRGNDAHSLSCNICTNLQPFNPSLEKKPRSFRWFPLLADQPKAYATIHNSSPHVHYTREATVVLTFYREEDTSTLTRTLTLAPHATAILSLPADQELQNFFSSRPGWCTAVSTNPYILTYYFTEHPSGMIGGDHGF